MPRQSSAELTTVPHRSEPQRDTTTNDWEQWLQRQFEPLHRALGQLLAEERKKFHDRLERKTSGFEIKLAKLSGAIDVLRGAAPPPPAKFPSIKAWSADLIYREGEIVSCDGSTYQATKDTARAPPSPEWTCLAAAGAGFTVRGTYNCHEQYKHFDIVVINGSSFVALKDAPGPCPGDDWRLFSGRGSRGGKGEIGARGPRGEKGENGAPGANALTIVSWMLDRARYRAIPMMSNGKPGPELELRGLFEQFLNETKG